MTGISQPPIDPRTSGSSTAADQRTIVGRFLRRWVDPWVDYVYWRLDLNDPATGKPAHNKVKTTVALGIALGITLGVAHHVFTGHGGDLESSEMTFLFAFVVLDIFASYGLAGLKIWADTKGGGTVQAVENVAKAAIAARRAAAPDGTFEVT